MSHPLCTEAGGAEAGFTLIEALVALVLGVAVVGLVLSTLKAASAGARRAQAVAAETEAFARAAQVLAGDAGHALMVPAALTVQGGPRDLRFAALPRDGGAPLALAYGLGPGPGGDSLLIRAEAPVLARGIGGFGPGVTIWQAPGPWELRYLDPRGRWLRDWRGPDLPRAFGLVALAAPQVVELVAEFPALMPPACARGPGPDCPLPAGVFP